MASWLVEEASCEVSPQAGGQPIGPAGPGDLAALSNEQLIDLINRAQQEAARRLTAPK